MADRVKKGIDMPICYPRLVQTGLHQTDFPTLCCFETDRLRMGGVVRHTQHTLGTPLSVFPGCVGYCAWGARSTPRKPTYQHIFGSGETGVSALTPIETPLYYLYESVDIWRWSRTRGKEITSTRTTRYVTLLSVVLALALTAALAACGSDEPSGGTAPDRTASTPRSGDAPTGTDAPVPADATAPPAASGSVETDREPLVALYNATDGGNWNESANWLSDAPLGEWEGVTTDGDGRVTKLGLIFNNLRGEIPAELGTLSKLEVLHLSQNRLSGEIPAELGSLSNLEVLNLGTNYDDLSGEIPAELGSLSNLERLLLGGNDLSGEIPAELGSLSNLTWLSLRDNDLSGEIPAELGSLSNLVDLNLYNNALSGEIPAELGSLSNLTSLSLGGGYNDLSGCVPSSLEDQLTSYSALGGLPFC